MWTYFEIDGSKGDAIVKAYRASGGQGSEDEVQEYLLADWPEGEEHQRWLDAAPIDEIVSWLLAGLVPADEDA